MIGVRTMEANRVNVFTLRCPLCGVLVFSTYIDTYGNRWRCFVCGMTDSGCQITYKDYYSLTPIKQIELELDGRIIYGEFSRDYLPQ